MCRTFKSTFFSMAKKPFFLNFYCLVFQAYVWELKGSTSMSWLPNELRHFIALLVMIIAMTNQLPSSIQPIIFDSGCLLWNIFANPPKYSMPSPAND
jgi:hypothetical protein